MRSKKLYEPIPSFGGLKHEDDVEKVDKTDALLRVLLVNYRALSLFPTRKRQTHQRINPLLPSQHAHHAGESPCAEQTFRLCMLPRGPKSEEEDKMVIECRRKEREGEERGRGKEETEVLRGGLGGGGEGEERG